MEASLTYVVSSRPAKATYRDLASKEQPPKANQDRWEREMFLEFRALGAHPEDQRLVPGIHMQAPNCL